MAYAKCVEQTFAFGGIVMLQEAIGGTEITVGVLEDPDTRALPVFEIVTPMESFQTSRHSISPV